jgi:hypothetical protein
MDKMQDFKFKKNLSLNSCPDIQTLSLSTRKTLLQKIIRKVLSMVLIRVDFHSKCTQACNS